MTTRTNSIRHDPPSPYEPAIARGTDGIWYRITYQGDREWVIESKDAVVPGPTEPTGTTKNTGATDWRVRARCGLEDVRQWGAKLRTAGEGTMVRRLGILMTGNEEKRLRSLGIEIRCVAEGSYHDEVGGPGCASVVSMSTRAWAELSLEGTLDIIVHINHPGWSREERSFACDLYSVDEVAHYLESLGMGFYSVYRSEIEELAAIRAHTFVREAGEPSND